MEKREKDIGVSPRISENEEKQISEEIKKRQESSGVLEGEIIDLYAKKNQLKEKQQELHDQIQNADILKQKLENSRDFEDTSYVVEKEVEKARLDKEFVELSSDIENIKAQIKEKEEEYKGLNKIGKDMADQDMLKGMPPEEKKVEEAKNKFEDSEKELDHLRKTLKEKKIELEEKEDELAILKSKLFMAESREPDSKEVGKIEREEKEKENYVEKLKKEKSELKEKIKDKKEEIPKLLDKFLDMKNELKKIKQQ